MRLFHALCATLGALLIVSTLPSGAYAADGPTLSEAFVLTKDGQLVDTLTLIDPSRTMSESACQPYAGKSSDQHVEFVTRDDATVCHMQLMYTNAENESEFSLEDSGEFVMTAHAERTLTESRKLFHPDLTLKSLSLSVEGEVQSATAGASTSATTYEGRTFSVTSWTDTVPQMITVKGSLTPGGDPNAAATTNALKDPWGVTPMPTSASASSSVAPTADAATATEESSDPPIALLIGLIVGLVLLVIGIVVVVYVVRAKRGKKATSGTLAAAPASHVHGPSPARGNEGVERYAPPTPIAPAATSAPAPAPAPIERPSASLNPPQPTPRDTGFTWEHKSRPMPTAAPVAATPEAPKRRRSRKDHRPAVFPERPAQPMAGQPMPGAGMSSSPLQVPMTGVSQRSAAPAAPPASPQAPTVAPTPPTTPTPTPASQPVVAVPQAVASAPQRETHTESASDSSLHRRSRQASEAQQAADAQPVFPSRRSQRQVVRDAHVPQPIPAPEEAPAAQQVPIPVPMPPVPPVPPPPARAVDAPETMLIPKVRQAAIPVPEPVVEPEPIVEPEPVAVVEPEPIVEPEPVAVVEPEPVAVVEPEPIVEPEPVAVVEPEPIVEPEPVAVVEPEPIVEPEPVAVVEPEPVAVVEPEPIVEPEPVAVVEPEPVAVVEPEPIVEPEPVAVIEPEPVVAAEPEPVIEPEPVAEPAPASSMLFIDDAEMPTAQIRRVRRERPADWGMPEAVAPVQQPEPAPQVSTPPMTPAPFEQSAPAMPSVVEQPQAPASPQMPAAFQAPAAATPFQEDWNAEISQKKEAPREQEGDKKRRRLWGWGKRRKKRNEAATAPEPEIDEPIESSHAPMISVDAQDEDDWNDWQNWNSRS